ncbi:MAG: DUF6472 family protein [Oscillibacter sp.]
MISCPSACARTAFIAATMQIDSYYCDEQLDEDEMASFLRGKLTACPFYHPGQSDYYLAGKQ